MFVFSKEKSLLILETVQPFFSNWRNWLEVFRPINIICVDYIQSVLGEIAK